MLSLVLLLLSCAQVITSQKCGDNYSKCAPKGAVATNDPRIGTDISSLFVNIVESVNGHTKVARDVARPCQGIFPRAPSASLCCGSLLRLDGAHADVGLQASTEQSVNCCETTTSLSAM